MPYPTPYTVSYSFSGFQASNPTTPLPLPALDNELANAGSGHRHAHFGDLGRTGR
jgi:hypothetical protein